jgi:hypothetical protein
MRKIYMALLAGVAGCSQPPTNSAAIDNSVSSNLVTAPNSVGNAVATANAPPAVPAPPAPAWRYNTTHDEMRGATTRTATTDSENTIDLGFPYGVVHGQIIIRQRVQDGLNIMFSVDEGQILCSSYSNNHISIKFDDGPIRTFGCDGPSGGGADVAFLQSEREVLRLLKGARRVIVEAEFYNAGPKQFTFNVAGLRWD